MALSLCPFDISVGVGAFVIGLNKISSFLSWELGFSVNVNAGLMVSILEKKTQVKNRTGPQVDQSFCPFTYPDVQLSPIKRHYLYMLVSL